MRNEEFPEREPCAIMDLLRIIALKRLRDFWANHADAEQPLRAWYAEAEAARWNHPTDIKKRYVHASILGENRVVFNIGGNKYRLVVVVHYNTGTVYVRFVGTYAEYDRVQVEEV